MEFVICMRCLTDGGSDSFGGLPFWILVFPYQIFAIFTLHEMINVRDTVAAFFRLLACFCPQISFLK